MLTNTRNEYGSVAKFFHWLIAIAILALLGLGFYSSFLDKASLLRDSVLAIHKSLGITILLLIVLRLIWKIINYPWPLLPASIPAWERVLAHLVHASLYILIFVQIFVGWIMSACGGHEVSFWGLFELNLPLPKNLYWHQCSGELHLILAWVIIGFVVVHILGALMHYFINRNQILQRMLPFHSIHKKSIFS